MFLNIVYLHIFEKILPAAANFYPFYKFELEEIERTVDDE